MTPDRWQHIDEIFQTAIELAPDERGTYITSACTGDAELQRQVETLLTHYEAAGDFPDDPLNEHRGTMALVSQVNESDPLLGQRLGAYAIEREIGRGGMGAVYLASRADNAYQKRVAIKVVKRGMDTDLILRRFRHERQILANLDHPNIARLLDGGTTADGLPYFVMEYIEGQPLYQYCDARRIGIRERLQLFCRVCDAVEYAHQNKVIHRDIKPSNILVNGAGFPKLFDFGIAKLLNPEVASDTAPQTATAVRLMTVEYASPEQVQGLPLTHLSDLYSLGVLLYESLTGHRPYRFRNRLLSEMARVISQEEPEYPSMAVSHSDKLLTVAHVDQEAMTIGQLCEMRNETPESLRRELSGSLDNITLKALSKEPAKRYQSAASLRDDIERYLDGRPVNAPQYVPSSAYQSNAAARDVTLVRSNGDKSIAVLPFKLLGKVIAEDTGEEYLGIGLADALITRLSNVRSLNVRPTSAILRYGDEGTDMRIAGRELGVEFILDGRIRRAATRVRISLQLLNVLSGTSVWARQFDEQFTDVLSLEDAISDQVAKALITQLTSEEHRQLKKRGTDSPEAFEAYLRGRYFWNTFTIEGFAKALVCFNSAVAHAPDYALAYTGIADYYTWLGIYAVMPFAETSAAAKDAALKAVELDDELAEAHSALGMATLSHDFDWSTSEHHLRQAVELNPNNAPGRSWYCYFLGMCGRFDEAMVQVKRAFELDPLTPIIHHTLNWTYFYARRYEESIVSARKLIEQEPQYGLAYMVLCPALWQTKQYNEAIEAGERGIALLGRTPYTLSWLTSAYAAACEIAEANVLLGEIQQMSATRYVSPYFLALVLCNLGDTERAFNELERALTIGDARLVWSGVDPQLDPLRSDPRFMEILRRINHPMGVK